MNNGLSIRERNHIDYTKCMLEQLLNNADCMKVIRGNPYYEYILHVIAHRDAFRRLELHTEYHDAFSHEHDLDKIGLTLILGKDNAKQIHRKIAKHHNIDWEKPDKMVLVEKIFDWESCHYTKLNSPKTAYEYATSRHPDKMELIEPVLKELDLWEKTNEKVLTSEKYEKIISSMPEEHILSEIRKSYNYLKRKF